MAIKTARQIWQGNPVTADHQPSPSEIVAYMEVLQAVAAGGIATWRDTKADLDGVSAADGDIGFVLDDPTPALSGIYQSDGTSWTKIAEVPPGFAGLTVGQISNDKLADMISGRLKGRASPGGGAPEDLSAEQIMAAFGLASAADLLTAENRVLVERFAAIRSRTRGLRSMTALRKLRLYRQTRASTAALYIAALFNRL